MEQLDLPELPDTPKLYPGDPGYNAFLDEDSPFYGLSDTWRPTAGRPVPTVRCARIKPDGERCGNRARRGTGLEMVTEVDPNTGELHNVHKKAYCRMHGGSSPNVVKRANAIVEAARLALSDSVPDAIDKLVQLATSNDAPHQVQLNAAKDILDRAGLKPGEKVDVDLTIGVEKPSEMIMKKLKSMNDKKELDNVEEAVVLDESE